MKISLSLLMDRQQYGRGSGSRKRVRHPEVAGETCLRYRQEEEKEKWADMKTVYED